jgi:hypothetical protein
VCLVAATFVAKRRVPKLAVCWLVFRINFAGANLVLDGGVLVAGEPKYKHATAFLASSRI